MGKLFLVPTPIGNLDDITLRAIKVLSSADIVLAEDTRTTQVLLKHLGLDKKLWSHHKFNEHAAVESVAATIAAGETVALVSDGRDTGNFRSRVPVGAHLSRTWHRSGNSSRCDGFCPGAGQQRFPLRPVLFRRFPAPEKGAFAAVAATRR